MSRCVLLLLAVAAACNRGGGGTTPAPTGPTCASVMPKMTEATVAVLARGGADDAMLAEARADAEALEPQLVELCERDRWSPELLACMNDTAPADFDRCTSLVTAEQEKHVIELRDAQSGDDAP